VGDALHPLTVFDDTTNHKRDGPATFLKDDRGYLQADAFKGYDGIYPESHGRIIEGGFPCPFLILRAFDMIPFIVTEGNCRFTFGDVPAATLAKPVPLVAATL
jgi:hypothetical protein